MVLDRGGECLDNTTPSTQETLMNLRRCGLAAFILGSALALPASAQQIKPGLWEITNNITSADGQMQAAMAEMQKQMAEMDPEQRKMMEQMMAKQGVQLNVGPGGAMRTQMCMTPEMAARNEFMTQQQGDCTHKRSPATGGTMKISFSCTNPRTTGEGEVNFSGSESYRMKMKITSDASGKPDTIKMDASAKWLGADCGNVKPFAMPKVK
jgi:hypothetical protein